MQKPPLTDTDLAVGITDTLSHCITQFPLNNLRVSDSKVSVSVPITKINQDLLHENKLHSKNEFPHPV